MPRTVWLNLIFVAALTAGAIAIDLPQGPKIFGREFNIHEGLDLKGGIRLVYEAQSENLSTADAKQAQASLIDAIDRRINILGVTEPRVEPVTVGDRLGIVVELPGATDAQSAINLIGQTAQLKFLEPDASGQFKETGLTGKNLAKAVAGTQQTGSNAGSNFGGQTFGQAVPIVTLRLDSEGTKIFAELTKRNLGKPLAIQLDDQIISAPTVQAEITDGNAIITGLDQKEAKELAKLLNAGALPVSIKLVNQQTIGPTLGQQSIQLSLVAAFFGIGLVILFMILYWRLWGVLASLALIIYMILNLAIYKIVPVTLSLAGIAGFILSIGMAVDANILIFARMREELSRNQKLSISISNGFGRAWPSIRDSNISSIITAIILFYGATGLVKGFALTLAIGILISMFTAIFVTRNLLYLTQRFMKVR